MAKTKISQFDTVASNNTDINSVNVAEGCPPSGINNAIREMASLLKKQEVGTDAMTSPDIDGGTIDGATIGGSSGVTIGVSDGTVSAPSIKFTGDTNTGIYRGGTDILKFVTAGTDAITIDASQNTTFAGAVAVEGASGAQITITDNSPSTVSLFMGAGNSSVSIGSTTSDPLTFLTANTERMDISSGGDISFYEDTGTTPKLFWDSSNESLAVGTTNVFNSKIIASSANGTAYGSASQLRISAGGVNNNRASIVFSDDALSDGKISYYPATTEADRSFSISARQNEADFVVKGNGRVGMGMTSPSRKLSIYDATSPYLALYDGSSGTTTSDGFQVQFASSNAYLWNYENGFTAFGTSATERMKIDANGHVTMPYQSAFLAQPTSIQTNILIDQSVTILFGTERFDQNADYNTASNTFTAPVTGKYHFETQIRVQSLDTGATYYNFEIVTTNRSYQNIIEPKFASDVGYWSAVITALADMDAGDTAYVRVRQQGGSQQTDFETPSHFSGYLVC